MDDQHLVLWCGPCGAKRQAQELILGPKLATRARLLSFDRTQSRVAIGLLTGHNSWRRHLYVMGLSNNRTVGSEVLGRKPQSTFCVSEALPSLRHAHLGSFYLVLEYIRKLSVAAIWNCGKGTGLL
jgi:hypothetical protein